MVYLRTVCRRLTDQELDHWLHFYSFRNKYNWFILLDEKLRRVELEIAIV